MTQEQILDLVASYNASYLEKLCLRHPAPKDDDILEERDERDPEGIVRMYEFKDGSWAIVGHRESDETVIQSTYQNNMYKKIKKIDTLACCIEKDAGIQ